ncbi:hypothetical protein V5O48_011842 [Marasmius crinis-equi]|uniref:Fungal-type protein kinase domain-containing protein n=1 Tax=Marasmius crinis-equi TaxID=585013 RepID=A0ABR3F4X1_9AGAR
MSSQSTSAITSAHGPPSSAQLDTTSPRTPPPKRDVGLPDDLATSLGTDLPALTEVHHTPHNRKAAGVVNYSTDMADEYVKRLYPRIANDSSKCFDVGIEVESFLEAYLGYREQLPESYKTQRLTEKQLNLLKNAASQSDEKLMYKPYANAFNGFPHVSAPESSNYTIIMNENSIDPFCDNLKIDGASYRNRAPQTTDFGLMETQIEMKSKVESDPFRDPPLGQRWETRGKGVKIESQERAHNLGQITTYAGISLAASYRTHLFTVLIVKDRARLIRWDHSGAIVTRAFEYACENSPLAEFYLRYAQLSRAEQGFEADVEPVDETDTRVQEALKALKAYDQDYWYGLSDQRREEVDPPRRWHRIILDGKEFIVPSPLYNRRFCSPFARTTRHSLAYYVEGKYLCFMKDHWRDLGSRSPPESEVYDLLKEKQIPHVAEKLAGADVTGSNTKAGPCKLILHRLVLKTLARSITIFTWGKVLVSCVAEVMETIIKAWEANILHRDVSAGNAMIYRDKETKEWHGLLIDWELCLVLDSERMAKPRRHGKTGTYQFMSAHLLQYEEGEPVLHDHTDDLESAFWTLVHTALHFLRIPENAGRRNAYTSASGRHTKIETMFDMNDAGALKQEALSLWYLAPASAPPFVLPGMTTLLSDIAKIFYTRYHDPVPLAPELEDPYKLIGLLKISADVMPPLALNRHAKRIEQVDKKPEPDYFENSIIPDNRKDNQNQRNTSRPLSERIDGLDGWPRSSKRSRAEELPHSPRPKRLKTSGASYSQDPDLTSDPDSDDSYSQTVKRRGKTRISGRASRQG